MFQTIVNLQGDMAIFPEDQLAGMIDTTRTFDITTLVMPLRKNHGDNPSSVKAVLTPSTQKNWSEAVISVAQAFPTALTFCGTTSALMPSHEAPSNAMIFRHPR